uniref:Leucine-rich repeat-containing N-terminal plant-type domain-containing protein n=1 Tax=Nelumbo nucifera TaxID=4432 RepID=A0A822YNW9_NELNU|nr:TPA_asm: hypothetical protein HUJ06_011546 [Nelumbo nucifera]
MCCMPHQKWAGLDTRFRGNYTSVSNQQWDGIVITQADFQALQASKREFVDPLGMLRSWNGSGFEAC